MTTTLALTPLSGHFAARIDTPFDELLDEASHQALRDALVEHKVLVLPGADRPSSSTSPSPPSSVTPSLLSPRTLVTRTPTCLRLR